MSDDLDAVFYEYRDGRMVQACRHWCVLSSGHAGPCCFTTDRKAAQDAMTRGQRSEPERGDQ